MRDSAGESAARRTAGVDEEAIRERAYKIYEERSKSGVSGDPIMDWLQAEHELADGRKRGEIRSEVERARPSVTKVLSDL